MKKPSAPPIERDSSDLLTIRGLGAKCGLSTRAIRQLMSEGKIPVIRIAPNVERFDWASVKSALAQFEVQGAAK